MSAKMNRERKMWLWTLLLSSLIGISIWYGRSLLNAPVAEWGRETVRTFSFFTNLSNLIIIIMAAALLIGRGRLDGFFKSPAVQAACCLYIAFVGLGFWFILGGPQNVPSWLFWIPEMTAHTLSPILGVVFFLRGVPKGELTWKHPFVWLAYPIAYLVYWLFRGPIVGYYPYFFVNVDAIGYSGVAAWSGALIVIFLVLGLIMWRIDSWQANRQVRLSATD
ncbi:Pr6Pr family membrane protein [Candidatus Leptofilum sp.]|uniref:Pr6Pr family membrane protein n=1 Tax=Candidatus Leptofilum sp. TaxID=3241576 RepID=UPI003B5BA89D